MTKRYVDADELIAEVRKMRHRHDLERNGQITWVEQSRVIKLIDWLVCGKNMEEFQRLQRSRL